jgi:hypothetical protein
MLGIIYENILRIFYAWLDGSLELFFYKNVVIVCLPGDTYKKKVENMWIKI